MGVGKGESMESKLYQMMQEILPNVEIEVRGVYLSREWTITFYNAPFYLPVSIQSEESEHREWKHCSFDFYSSSLFQTYFIVFVTFSSL